MRSLRWFAAPIAAVLMTASPAEALTKIREPIPLSQGFRVVGTSRDPFLAAH